MVTKKTFTFNGEDADILAWLDSQDNQTQAVRDAIRAFMGRDRVTLRSVLEAVSRIEGRLASGDFTPGDGTPAGEDPELAAALDNLGL